MNKRNPLRMDPTVFIEKRLRLRFFTSFAASVPYSRSTNNRFTLQCKRNIAVWEQERHHYQKSIWFELLIWRQIFWNFSGRGLPQLLSQGSPCPFFRPWSSAGISNRRSSDCEVPALPPALALDLDSSCRLCQHLEEHSCAGSIDQFSEDRQWRNHFFPEKNTNMFLL